MMGTQRPNPGRLSKAGFLEEAGQTEKKGRERKDDEGGKGEEWDGPQLPSQPP